MSNQDNVRDNKEKLFLACVVSVFAFLFCCYAKLCCIHRLAY